MIAYEADMIGKATVFLMQMLNEGVYTLISVLCKLFMNLSETRLFGDEIIGSFLSRIYVVIGILMLFKLAFSLLNAIINPDALTDKEKGMQKIIPRTILALSMLIFSPFIFEKALEWQSHIAMAVPRLIIGTTTTSSDLSESDQGEELAATAISAFMQFNEKCGDSSETKENIMEGTEGTVHLTLDLASQRCQESQKQYMFQFNGFVSMVVGIFMVVLLASYCIDIAIRVIKIGLLRILAPIPIISYIDPKSEKNGAFGNWLKECTSTYLELFIKLAILYFVLFILGGIAGKGNSVFDYPSGTDSVMQGYMKLFLILGSFFFMGKAAEFICNILGVKKPDNKGGWMKGLAGLGAALGIGAAGISGAVTNYRGALASQAARGVNKNYAKAFGSGILGLGSGLLVAGSAVAGAQKGKMNAALAAAYKRNTAFSQAAGAGATLFGKMGAYTERAFTGQTQADVIESKIKGYEAYKTALGNVAKRVSGEMVKKTYTYGEIEKDSGMYANYKSFLAGKNAAAASNQSSFTYDLLDENGEFVRQATMSVRDAEMNLGYLLTTNEDNYIKQVLGRTLPEGESDALLERYVQEANAAGVGIPEIEAVDEHGKKPYVISSDTGRKAYKKADEISDMRLSELRKQKTKYAANDSATKPK